MEQNDPILTRRSLPR